MTESALADFHVLRREIHLPAESVLSFGENPIMDLVFAAIIMLLIPFVIGCYILLKFKADEVSRWVGFLTLTSVVTNILMFSFKGITWDPDVWRFYWFIRDHEFLLLIPELILILVIAYRFRRLFMKEKPARAFFIWSVVRLSYIFIYPELLVSPEPYFYWQLYLAIFFGSIFPSIYSITGLVFIRKRVASMN